MFFFVTAEFSQAISVALDYFPVNFKTIHIAYITLYTGIVFTLFLNHYFS